MAAASVSAQTRRMDYTPPRNGLPTENLIGICPDTRARLHLRAHQLASFAGHPAPHVTQAHFEQAEREVISDPHKRRAPAHPASEREAVLS